VSVSIDKEKSESVGEVMLLFCCWICDDWYSIKIDRVLFSWRV